MRLFTRREPWTHDDWWQAGKEDAMHCIAMRYGGSDYGEEVLSYYIRGYWHGQELMMKTVPCDRLASSISYSWEFTSHVEPGLIPERWSLIVLLIWWVLLSVLAISAFIAVIVVFVERSPL